MAVKVALFSGDCGGFGCIGLPGSFAGLLGAFGRLLHRQCGNQAVHNLQCRLQLLVISVSQLTGQQTAEIFHGQPHQMIGGHAGFCQTVG